MLFDNIILNPPFNISVKDSVSGTGGDVSIGKRFRKKANRHLKDNGNLGVICVKSILKDVLTDSNEVVWIDLMTVDDVWNYNTCWTIEKKVKRSSIPTFGNDICGKMFGVNTNGVGVSQWNYHEFNREWNKVFQPGTTRTLVELPQKANNFQLIYADVHDPYPAKPRFAFTLMESVKSYTVSVDAYAARMSGWVEFATVAEANRFRCLIDQNPAVQYFNHKMKLKGRAKDCSRFLKSIDLLQFTSGSKIAKEWNLNQDQINIILHGGKETRSKIDHPIIDCQLEKLILEESKNYLLSRNREREKELGEIFTPTSEVIEILKRWPLDAWEEGRTWLDMAAGNGQLLIPVALIKRNLGHKDWLKTIYATDIDNVNVNEFRQRLSNIAGDYPNKSETLCQNIIKENALSWLFYNFDIQHRFFTNNSG